jgi:hypothetical protein
LRAVPQDTPGRIHRVAFRKKLYDTPDALQADLYDWMAIYNEQGTHQGRWCFGKTPMQTFVDSAAWAREKQSLAKAAEKGVHGSFDPADTHHARSTVRQIKCKLLRLILVTNMLTMAIDHRSSHRLFWAGEIPSPANDGPSAPPR